MKIAEAFVEVRVDDDALTRDLARVEQRTESSARSTAGAWARAFATAALGAGIKRSIDAASDLEQAIGGTAAVFGEASREIDSFAATSAESAGLSARAARELTSQIGGLLQGFGFTQEEAAKTSVSLAQLGADLAATFGGNPEEAVQALGAALRGETDPIERYGISLNQTAVNLKAVELGLATSTSEVDLNAKAQATLAIITERSANAQGQFAREADTAAGQSAITAAKAEDAAASLGDNLLPVYTRVVEVVGAAAEAFGNLPGPVQTGIVALTGVALVAKPVVDGIKAMREGFGGLSSGTGALAGKLGGLKGALGALGFVGAVAGAVQMARSMDRATVDVDRLAAALTDLTAAEEEQLQRTLVVASGWGQLDDIVSQTAESNVKAAERLLAQAEAAGIAGEELEALRAIVDEKRAADVQGAKDQDAYREEVEEATGATRGLTSAIDEQVDHLGNLQEAMLSQFDSNLAYRRSTNEAEDAVADLTAAEKDHGKSSEEYERALIEAEDAMLGQAAAAVQLADDQAKAAGQTLSAKDKAKIYRDELVRLRDSLAPGSPLRSVLDSYLRDLEKIPSSIETKVKLSVSTSGAQFSAGAAINAWERQQQGRFLGGPFQAGDTLRLNEAGVEAIQFGQPGTVIPAHDLGDGRGGPTFNGPVTIVSSATRAEDVYDETLWRLVS